MAINDNSVAVELLLKLEKELKQKKVLIVDRHSNARDSLRLTLSAIGITSVSNAGNSAEVLRQVKSSRFDIILSDYLLDDGRDGQQLLEELRLQHLIPLATVFMVITGERGYHNVISVAELAPDDYLVKPFTADQLQARLLKSIYKKHVFSGVYRRLDEGAFVAALNAVERLLHNESEFTLDAMRIKSEILNVLGRHAEAETIYRDVLARRAVPWARMGLAAALRGQQQLQEAEELAAEIVREYPHYLSAYDFLAGVREEQGKLPEAQEILQQAASISPNNSTRQRIVGDVAVRNDDLDAAEKAYGKVIERHRGSSLKQIDDYANLGRVLLDKGQTGGARQIVQELRREWRGSKQGDFAATVMDSLCCEKEGERTKAEKLVSEALALHEELEASAPAQASQKTSTKLIVDLAHACLAVGDEQTAQQLLRKVAAENNENRSLLDHISGVFSKTGRQEAGQALLDEVGKEIVSLNNRGVLAARNGRIEDSVELLIDAAERVPNIQFLVNASKAILTLMDRKGWNEERAEQIRRYLERAEGKNARDPRVISARELYRRIARKYGIETS